jgi:hypothetical protein
VSGHPYGRDPYDLDPGKAFDEASSIIRPLVPHTLGPTAQTVIWLAAAASLAAGTMIARSILELESTLRDVKERL